MHVDDTGQTQGIVSSLSHNTLRTGDTATVDRPAGAFRIPIIADFPIVLIAAGIGIAPFIGFLNSADLETMPETILLYGTRDQPHHAFHREIERMKASLPRLSIQTLYSRPSGKSEAERSFDRRGRINAASIAQDLSKRREILYVRSTRYAD